MFRLELMTFPSNVVEVVVLKIENVNLLAFLIYMLPETVTVIYRAINRHTICLDILGNPSLDVIPLELIPPPG